MSRTDYYFRGTFHGLRFIAQPVAGEKQPGGWAASEAFEHPGVGTTAGFPEGDVAAVGGRNGPTDVSIRILKELADVTAKIDVEQSLRAGKGRRWGPQTLAVGCPIETRNATVALQLERLRFSSFRGNELDFRLPPLRQGNRFTIGRKAPVVLASLDAKAERSLLAGDRIELDEMNILSGRLT